MMAAGSTAAATSLAGALTVIKALGVTAGPVNTEVKLTADGPRVIEVNGQLGGYLAQPWQASTGLNMIAASVRTPLGHEVDLPDGHGSVAYTYLVTPPADVPIISAPSRE